MPAHMGDVFIPGFLRPVLAFVGVVATSSNTIKQEFQ
jgi:hypothetical protein